MSENCPQLDKNAHHNFLNPKVTSSNDLFFPANTPNPKGVHFTLTQDKEKQYILTTEKLKVGHFYRTKGFSGTELNLPGSPCTNQIVMFRIRIQKFKIKGEANILSVSRLSTKVCQL